MKTEKTAPKTEKTSKADLIRAEIAKLAATGEAVRPRDVVQALAKRGIVVAPPQVSTALKAFNNGANKPTKPTKVAAKVSKAEAPPTKRAASKLSGADAKTPPQVNEPSLGAVRHAKAFVDMMGSLEAAQTALAAYESLLAG